MAAALTVETVLTWMSENGTVIRCVRGVGSSSADCCRSSSLESSSSDGGISGDKDDGDSMLH